MISARTIAKQKADRMQRIFAQAAAQVNQAIKPAAK
jgi:hypothetical protein